MFPKRVGMQMRVSLLEQQQQLQQQQQQQQQQQHRAKWRVRLPISFCRSSRYANERLLFFARHCRISSVDQCMQMRAVLMDLEHCVCKLGELGLAMKKQWNQTSSSPRSSARKRKRKGKKKFFYFILKKTFFFVLLTETKRLPLHAGPDGWNKMLKRPCHRPSGRFYFSKNKRKKRKKILFFFFFLSVSWFGFFLFLLLHFRDFICLFFFVQNKTLDWASTRSRCGRTFGTLGGVLPSFTEFYRVNRNEMARQSNAWGRIVSKFPKKL